MLERIPLAYYAFAGLLNFVTSFILAIFVFFKKTKSPINRIFSIFALGASCWGLFHFLWLSTIDKSSLAEFYLRTVMLFVIFVPATFTHFILAFLKVDNNKKINIGNYLVSFIIGLTVYTQLFAKDISAFLVFPYWLKPGPVFHFHLIHFLGNTIYSHFLMLQALKRHSGILRNQILYIFLGTAIGYTAGVFNYFPWYRLPIPPFLNPLVSIYVAFVSYAIIRYHLMDIRIVITRAGIFLSVYSLVLGLPFALAFGFRDVLIDILNENWWMAPLVTSTVLATVGPFIYLYIDKKAEQKLFEEQLRYQATLKQASIGMGRIKNLNRLVNLIVHIVTRTVRLEHSVLYIDDPRAKKFVFGAKRSRSVRQKAQETIEKDSALVKRLMRSHEPIIYEEIKQMTQDYGDRELTRLESELKELDAAVVVPSFVDERLLAIIVLGEKISRKTYSEEDIAVFSILANQAALAIENALFYDDMKETHEQLFKAEKMATIGTMADGLSHQINNRLHALGFIAGDALDTIKLKKNLQMSPELKEMMVDLEHALSRIQENVTQGGDIVQGLLKYTRKGEEGYTDIRLEDLVNAAVEMTQFKIKQGEMDVIKDFDSKTPTINGNFTQLQEVFFNLIDNAYDAMMQRKEEFKEPGFKPTIHIEAVPNGKHLNIKVIDNGIGIKTDDKDKLFTPFFTTKLSSKKGTGLGLYVIQKLIEENHNGKVRYESEYKIGTSVYVTLPLKGKEEIGS